MLHHTVKAIWACANTHCDVCTRTKTSQWCISQPKARSLIACCRQRFKDDAVALLALTDSSCLNQSPMRRLQDANALLPFQWLNQGLDDCLTTEPHSQLSFRFFFSNRSSLSYPCWLCTWFEAQTVPELQSSCLNFLSSWDDKSPGSALLLCWESWPQTGCLVKDNLELLTLLLLLPPQYCYQQCAPHPLG